MNRLGSSVVWLFLSLWCLAGVWVLGIWTISYFVPMAPIPLSGEWRFSVWQFRFDDWAMIGLFVKCAFFAVVYAGMLGVLWARPVRRLADATGERLKLELKPLLGTLGDRIAAARKDGRTHAVREVLRSGWVLLEWLLFDSWWPGE